ncbi:anti-phage dCTP deaminase [Methylobacterium haplocladii]|uniref:Deoxycytidylate deaminase n=1 Tax=Methylobacterium haplocladii TaxID=1176176 RepID=A0A512IKM5_9HYPH|nr:anti-phage dCTP deaminase [Methylobacterium haplocladii]GEO98266.1 deoxycytidylate deaminase [Methylobacterium haplocladii]GJD84339.1 tRNA-specific adenosine deaminase [Methylobacterium haplocladii]GLS58440.1 deoxycytidylate deaminase [Methylobacterium haplocladii]
MVAKIPLIRTPELFIGFVAPIGADVKGCIADFRKCFEELKYNVEEIKATDVFDSLKDIITPDIALDKTSQYKRYNSYIKYGNKLRAEFGDNAFLAAIAIGKIIKLRQQNISIGKCTPFEKTVYLIHQFKRKEEISLLRSVYGRLFYQVSLYSRRGARVDNLATIFASDEGSANINEFKAQAESIIQIDEDEKNTDHGQRVSKVFSDGDLIISDDVQTPSTYTQAKRFCELLFGANFISPNKNEYGMFIAKAAALRTLDLSRQVGAAIFSCEGEIVSIGSNEVPKGTGGTYWCDDDFDDREYLRKQDSNDKRKKEILSEIANIFDQKLEDILSSQKIQDSQFMDALEYGRIVHAEMSAISDAARLGHPTKGSSLYCTTFPCHMCAKHIVAAGIKKVIFLEPYPKSLVTKLHSDSILVEGSDRGKYKDFPSAEFEHFFGISPRRYRELFERGSRKNADGSFKEWIFNPPRPNLSITTPYYSQDETKIFADVIATYMRLKNLPPDILDPKPLSQANPAVSTTGRSSASQRRKSVPADKPVRGSE